MWQMKLVYRRGFTLFLTFVAVLLLVFATLLAQTSEMIQLVNMQKQAFKLCDISVENSSEASLSAESAVSGH
jgi:type III secretory pathway component EscR